jgi:hypothetical protein
LSAGSGGGGGSSLVSRTYGVGSYSAGITGSLAVSEEQADKMTANGVIKREILKNFISKPYSNAGECQNSWSVRENK